MSARTSATRYAKALLDVATSDDQARTFEANLTAFAAALSGHRELHQALTSPSVPAARKRGIVTAVADRLGLAPVPTRTLQLMADRHRLGAIDDLLAVFRERLLDRQKIVRADVRSAAPLSADALAAITARLGAITGKTVAVNAGVDPELMGGVVATVGSTVYDGSVKSQLARLRRQLLASG